MSKIKFSLTLTQARKLVAALDSPSVGDEYLAKLFYHLKDEIEAKTERRPLRKIVSRQPSTSFDIIRIVKLECNHTKSFKWTNTNAEKFRVGKRIRCDQCLS